MGKGGCKDLSEDAVDGGTGTGYDHCPVTADRALTETVTKQTYADRLLICAAVA